MCTYPPPLSILCLIMKLIKTDKIFTINLHHLLRCAQMSAWTQFNLNCHHLSFQLTGPQIILFLLIIIESNRQYTQQPISWEFSGNNFIIILAYRIFRPIITGAGLVWLLLSLLLSIAGECWAGWLAVLCLPWWCAMECGNCVRAHKKPQETSDHPPCYRILNICICLQPPNWNRWWWWPTEKTFTRKSS